MKIGYSLYEHFIKLILKCLVIRRSQEAVELSLKGIIKAMAYDEGRFDEAILEFNKALQYEPDYGEAKIALEKALRNSQ